MTSLRFGIIGVGNISTIHAAAIRNTPGAELVAVATRNGEHGHAFVAEHGGTWHADYRALLAQDDVDAVAICAPHDLHASMTIAAAAAHKHILVEKPMAITTSECDAMIAACERARVTLGVIFQMRFEPLSRKLKSLIDRGALGRLLWVSANTIWYRTDEYYRSGPWRGTLAHEGGGVLINQAIHLIDLMLWLTGAMPARVTARMKTLNHQIQVEDGALAILEFADHCLGLIQATTVAYPGYPERLEFHGTRGSAVYHKGQGKLEWHLIEPREDGLEEAAVASGAAQPMDINAAGHTAQYKNFVAAIQNHTPPSVDGHEGRKSIELVQAIYRSARESQV
jgi:predicted dehydrogenase